MNVGFKQPFDNQVIGFDKLDYAIGTFGVDLAGTAPVAEHGINDSAHPATWIYQNIAE